MSDTDAIVQDPETGLFGFRLEMGRDHGGIRMQARRSGFVTETAAKTEYRRLCRQGDAQHPKPRLSGSVQNVCEDGCWPGSRNSSPTRCTDTGGCSV